MAVPTLTNIANGDLMDGTVVDTNFDNIYDVLNGNIENSNFTADSTKRLAGNKVDLSSNSEFTTEHDPSDYTHKITSNRVNGLFLSTTSAHEVSVHFQKVQLIGRTASDTVLVTSNYTNTVDIEDLGDDGRAIDEAEAAETMYYIYFLYTSTTGFSALVISSESAASEDFWDGVDANVTNGNQVDYYLQLGVVYNDSESNFTAARPIAGGSIGTAFHPLWSHLATGIFVGLGTGGQSITGIGFRPELVLCVSHGGQGVAPLFVMKSDVITGTSSLLIAPSGIGNNITDGIRSLDDDGFTVGANAYVDTASEVYSYYAFKKPQGI